MSSWPGQQAAQTSTANSNLNGELAEVGDMAPSLEEADEILARFGYKEPALAAAA